MDLGKVRSVGGVNSGMRCSSPQDLPASRLQTLSTLELVDLIL